MADQIKIQQSMMSAGIKAPDYLEIDGKIHRFCSETGAKSRNKSPGWYVLNGLPDGKVYGAFGCWKQGISTSYWSNEEMKTDRTILLHLERIREDNETERLKNQEFQTVTIQQIWQNAAPASAQHPYLKRKNVQPFLTKVGGDGRLIVPLFDTAGELASLQYIDATGEKRYHPGLPVGGKYLMLGASGTELGVSGTPSNTIYIAEGFATAATIAHTMNAPCVVAFSAGNLVTVAGIIRNTYQNVIIVADHDKTGVGKNYADQAAAKYGCKVVMPPMLGDANDYVAAGHDLHSLLSAANYSAYQRLGILRASELPPEFSLPDEIVEDLIVAGSTSIIYGDSNSGKTFYSLALARSVATGERFLHRQCDKGVVVYLASESPNSVKTRILALRDHYQDVCNLDNLLIVPVPVNFFTSDKDVNDLICAIGSNVKLIIADTLARIANGANENSGEDMGPVMARFDRLASETGAAVVIVHHSGKDKAQGARGWSGIRAHVDTEIEIEEAEDGSRSATVTKQRELSSKNSTMHFRLHLVEIGTSKFGSKVTTCVAVESTPNLLNVFPLHPKAEAEANINDYAGKIALIAAQYGIFSDDGEILLDYDSIKFMCYEMIYAEFNTDRKRKNLFHLKKQCLENGILTPVDEEGEWFIVKLKDGASKVAQEIRKRLGI